MNSSPRIVITGDAGNLGNTLCQYLGADWDVIPVGRSDMARIGQLIPQGCVVVLHGAFSPSCQPATEPQRFVTDNLMTTAVALEQARAHKAKLFAFVSSAAVYGDNPAPKETDELKPFIVSGAAKALGERMVRDYCTAHDIPFQIYRVFNIFGGNDTFSVVSKLLNAARGDYPFILNNGGRALRDFIHVADLARNIVCLWRSGFINGAINLASGKGVAIEDLVSVVRKHYPQLKIEHRSAPEVAVCVADMTLSSQFLYSDLMPVTSWLGRSAGGK